MDDQHRPPPGPPTDAALIAELREAVRARDDFIAIASHELRNPMTPVPARAELLRAQARREGASPALEAGLDRMAAAVRRFVRHSTTLLDVSRVNAGNLRLDPTPMDLAAAVREVAADHEAAARPSATAAGGRSRSRRRPRATTRSC